MKIRLRCLIKMLVISSLSISLANVAVADNYNPLQIPSKVGVIIKDLSLFDKSRQREIPIKAYISGKKSPSPVVLFSHGLGGSRNSCSYLGKHLAARSYVGIFIQHPGSDEYVWKNESPANRISTLKKAANLQNTLLRYKDIPAVLNQLEKWNQEPNHVLFERMDLSKVGMSGHSFGAVTTQALSGQTIGFTGTRFCDKRIKAAIAYSPSSPRRGSPKRAFASVKVPWLLMTGTKDISRIGGQSLESRLAVYPALPTGDKYELVLFNAEHSAFTDRMTKKALNRSSRNPNHHQAILAISSAFWDSYLKNSEQAKIWLKGIGPSSVLEKKDRWQFK